MYSLANQVIFTNDSTLSNLMHLPTLVGKPEGHYMIALRL